MKLLLTVFLTPDYITKYRTSAINKKSGSEFDRIDKFLTMVDSIKNIDWESVEIYLSMDPSWERFRPEITKYLHGIFPNSVLGERLSLVSEWRSAIENFSDEDTILLQANDDHILVPDSISYLKDLEKKMAGDESIKMSCVTHFPEFRGLLHKEKELQPVGEENVILVDNAIGTLLVKAHFLKSWFSSQNFPSDIKIVRPDNPFGKSVSFPPSKLLIPDKEIMRHMDGYSHALLYRPLPPIRNTKLFSEKSKTINDLKPWKVGLWPVAQFGYRGKGVDFYKQNHDENESLVKSLRIDLANQISANALSINLQRSFTLINPRYREIYFYKLIIIFLLLLNYNFLRNLPDFALQEIYDKSGKDRTVNDITLSGKKRLIYNLGFLRGTVIHYRQRFWWLMPRNLHLSLSILKRKIVKSLRKWP